MSKTKKMKRLRDMGLSEIDDEVRFICDHKIKLEVKLKDLEEEENYLQAKRVHEQLKELNLLEGMYIEQKLKIQQTEEKKMLTGHLDGEEDEFKDHWRKKNEEYRNKAEEVILSTLQRQKLEENEIYDRIKSELMTKKIKYSRKILEMRKQMKLFVSRKKYVEAEAIQKKIKPIELAEIERHHELQEATLINKMKIVKKRHANEIHALKQRIEQGREELRVQMEQEWKMLKRKHENINTEVVLKQKKYYAGYKAAIEKQTDVLQRHYKKNVINFQTKFEKMGLNKYQHSQYILSKVNSPGKASGKGARGTPTKKKKTEKRKNANKLMSRY